MAENFKLAKLIESSFIEDNLIIPKKGECKLELAENFAILFLKIKEEKKLFEDEEKEQIITHNVNKMFKMILSFNQIKFFRFIQNLLVLTMINSA